MDRFLEAKLLGADWTIAKPFTVAGIMALVGSAFGDTPGTHPLPLSSCGHTLVMRARSWTDWARDTTSIVTRHPYGD
jgi:hypothetical protein